MSRLQDQFRKKVKRPPNGGGASLEIADIRGQVPNIDDVLSDANEALRGADEVLDRVRADLIGKALDPILEQIFGDCLRCFEKK